MHFPNKYNCLNQNEFVIEDYKLVPIRFKDRLAIMKWRNKQIYHLRQDIPLTFEKQDEYFNIVISNLFKLDQPSQILFSYLKNNKCIGYGGLVHINWIDKNAEISFIMDTELELDFFKFHWSKFLQMIELIAFKELNLKKIYTYAFDLRPNLYEVLLDSGYFNDAVLKQHCFFNGKYLDVVIHSKINLEN
jgi:RimJ/RimL family protein N-acetyltransferase